MGHVIFFILHIAALLFGFVGLIITIPLHIIYAVVASKNTEKPDVVKTRICPFCKETVMKEAVVCKHCSKDLDKVVDDVITYDNFGNKLVNGSR